MYWGKAKTDSKAQLVSIKLKSENTTLNKYQSVLSKESCQCQGWHCRAGTAGLLLKAEHLTSQQSKTQPLTGPHHPGLCKDLLKAADWWHQGRAMPVSFGLLGRSSKWARRQTDGSCRIISASLPCPAGTHFQPEEMQLKEMSQSTQPAVHYHTLAFSFGRRVVQHHPEPTIFLKPLANKEGKESQSYKIIIEKCQHRNKQNWWHWNFNQCLAQIEKAHA